MKLSWLLIAGLAIAPIPAGAQTGTPAPAAAGQNPLKTTNVERYYMPVRLFLQAAADVMPAEKYTFRLTPEQMDFGQWINHSTERNYLDCSTLRAEPNPMPKAKVDALKTKDEIVRNLRESFDYCDATFAKLDDQKILSSPQMVASFLHTSVHNNEIYGNIVGYLRVNHIVPPSTDMVQQMMKEKKTPAQMLKEMMDKYNKK